MNDWIDIQIKYYGENSVITPAFIWIRDNIPDSDQKQWLMKQRRMADSQYYYMALTKCIEFLGGEI